MAGPTPAPQTQAHPPQADGSLLGDKLSQSYAAASDYALRIHRLLGNVLQAVSLVIAVHMVILELLALLCIYWFVGQPTLELGWVLGVVAIGLVVPLLHLLEARLTHRFYYSGTWGAMERSEELLEALNQAWVTLDARRKLPRRSLSETLKELDWPDRNVVIKGARRSLRMLRKLARQGVLIGPGLLRRAWQELHPARQMPRPHPWPLALALSFGKGLARLVIAMALIIPLYNRDLSWPLWGWWLVGVLSSSTSAWLVYIVQRRAVALAILAQLKEG